MRRYFTIYYNKTFDYKGRESHGAFWRYVAVFCLGLFFLTLLRPYAFDARYDVAQGRFTYFTIKRTYIFIPWITIYTMLWLTLIGYGVRRLHDAGYSGWWVLTSMGIFLLVFVYLCTLPSEPKANQYGPRPR